MLRRAYTNRYCGSAYPGSDRYADGDNNANIHPDVHLWQRTMAE